MTSPASSAPSALALTLALLAPATLALGPTGCAASGDDDGPSCTGAKCDDLDLPDSEVPDSPCDGAMVDRSGRGNQKVAGRLHDPLATAVFAQGDDCPSSFQDIMAKLRTNDADRCDPATAGAGMTTRAISETAQLAGAPTSYRLVTSRACGGRDDHELLFSLFGVAAGAAELPGNVELIAFDPTAKAFNYYETDGQGTINFFGTSRDFLKGVGADDDRRCAGCHVGGGLVMKELQSPWVHWEGDTTTPGAKELIAAHPELGRASNGIELESTIRAGNAAWNESRLAALKEVGDTRELLRPLFCDREINVHTHGPSAFGRVPVDFLVPDAVGRFSSISIDNAVYTAALERTGQQVGATGKADTFFPFAFAKKGAIDDATTGGYLVTLKNAGILDDALIEDVMLVDFTRAVFSDDRCDLLELVPSIPAAELTVETLREGLAAAVAGAAAGTPAAALAANLASDEPTTARTQPFVDACVARVAADADGFMDDVLALASLNRDQARQMLVMEFAESMPDDDQSVAAGSRLDPNTCQLTTGFVAAE